MFKDMTIEEFLSELSSSKPVPGGGSVAALSAALSSSLISMVARLSVGKKGFEDVEDQMKEIITKCNDCTNEFLNYIDEDSEAFDKVMNAFKMPKETDDDKKIRKMVIQSSMKGAALTPFKIAEKANDLLEYAETVVMKGNQNAITDGLVSAMLARTAVLSALYNTKINQQSIKDEKFNELLTLKIDLLENSSIQFEEKIMKNANL